MKPTITKQTAHDLQKYAREINELEQEIQQRKTKIVADVREFDCRVIEIGQKLIQAKLRCLKGDWELWMQSNITVHPNSARIYMRIASNPQRVVGAQSIRQALALLAEGKDEAEHKADKQPQLPAYLEALGRVTKLVGYIGKHPLTDWPSEGKEKLREDLEPMCRELWPERFA